MVASSRPPRAGLSASRAMPTHRKLIHRLLRRSCAPTIAGSIDRYLLDDLPGVGGPVQRADKDAKRFRQFRPVARRAKRDACRVWRGPVDGESLAGDDCEPIPQQMRRDVGTALRQPQPQMVSGGLGLKLKTLERPLRELLAADRLVPDGGDDAIGD